MFCLHSQIQSSKWLRVVTIDITFGDEAETNLLRKTAMAEKYARLEPFDCEGGDWESYQERLEQLFVVNEVTENKARRAALLTVCGQATYKLLKTLCAPKKPAEVSYDDLCKKLAEHFNPKPSEIMQRLAFHSRVRAHGESVVEFVATLRRLAADCKFGDSLDENLRDRLVCGINDLAIQRQLLNESNLDLKKAMQIATATEATGKHLSQRQATTAKARRTRRNVHM